MFFVFFGKKKGASSGNGSVKGYYFGGVMVQDF
jgi:hypothetical protein